MTFRTEFPDFDPATMPAIPSGFDDVSWHNDMCPSFLNEAAGLIIFVDYVDCKEREFPEIPRFTLGTWDNGNTGNDIVSTDDWQLVLAAIEARDTSRAVPHKRAILSALAALADDETRKRFLAAWWLAMVGYDPFEDDATATIESVAALIMDYLETAFAEE